MEYFRQRKEMYVSYKTAESLAISRNVYIRSEDAEVQNKVGGAFSFYVAIKQN